MEVVSPLTEYPTKTPHTEEVKIKLFQRILGKISFLRMSKEKKAEIADEILTETYGSKLYWLEMGLSSILATLGLLTSSIPVVIGAMLIAPLLQPIKAFSFAVSTGNKTLYFKAMKMLGLSIGLAIVIAYLVTHIVPFASLNNEILSRTSPTLVDLFIALGSGIIAILSLAFKKLSESIAGVAMAVALMPPLCVLGIGLHFSNMDVMSGSGLLFLTNLISIIVVGVILFYMFGFSPTNKTGKQRSAKMIILVLVTIGILFVPLRKGMQTIAFNFKTNTIIYQTFDDFRAGVNPSISLQYIKFQPLDDSTLKVDATLDIPSTLKITDMHKQKLTQLLSQATHKSIKLQLKLIEVSSVSIIPPKKKKNTHRDEELLYLQQAVGSQFTTLFPDAELQNLSLSWGENKDTVKMDLEFASSQEKDSLEKYLQGWKHILTKYFHKKFIMYIKVDYISKRELNS